MVSLKTPVSSIPVRVGINLITLNLIMEENMKSSPTAFGRGGRPILAQANISHSKGRDTNIVFIPRLAASVRVPDRS